MKHSYLGIGKRSVGVVHLDTTCNFLAVGDGFATKVWDMDNVNLLATINADGGLPAYPCIRFNKEGSLLAVSTEDHGIKVLESTNVRRLVCSTGSHGARSSQPSRGGREVRARLLVMVSALAHPLFLLQSGPSRISKREPSVGASVLHSLRLT